jgi:hypothetical protein
MTSRAERTLVNKMVDFIWILMSSLWEGIHSRVIWPTCFLRTILVSREGWGRTGRQGRLLFAFSTYSELMLKLK